MENSTFVSICLIVHLTAENKLKPAGQGRPGDPKETNHV